MPNGEFVVYSFRACFTPTHTGSYQLNVYWGDSLLPNCPYQVTVGAICDASRVICAGDGLLGGVVGKEIKAFIDTRKGAYPQTCFAL